jgi:hypothetical protein
VLEPRPERDHERLASLLANRPALLGARAADHLLDRVKRCDAFQRFVRDRGIAALGNVEDLASQMRPAERECDSLLGCGCRNLLVGGVAVALHDAAIAIEQL